MYVKEASLTKEQGKVVFVSISFVQDCLRYDMSFTKIFRQLDFSPQNSNFCAAEALFIIWFCLKNFRFGSSFSYCSHSCEICMSVKLSVRLSEALFQFSKNTCRRKGGGDFWYQGLTLQKNLTVFAIQWPAGSSAWLKYETAFQSACLLVSVCFVYM